VRRIASLARGAGLLTLLTLFERADISTARDDIRHDGAAPHRSYAAQGLLPLLALFARADIRTARDNLRHEAAASRRT